MQLPADGIVVQATELMCDESSMTGETDLVKKNTYAECVKKRDEILSEGERNTAGPHDVPSPVLMAGTKIV